METSLKRLVIKIGTSSLTYKNGKINISSFEKLARIISDLKNRDIDVILITSGAIGIGSAKLGFKGKPESVMDRQASAAVGQCALMNLYDKIFAEYGYTVAQLLLTKDIKHSEQALINTKNTFETLFTHNSIPIVNENDAISTDEIFGENDALSAFVASLVGADTLCIMTDCDGLYDKNPAIYNDAKIIKTVDKIDDEIRSHCGKSVSGCGTGGMITKINAAETATSNGINTYFINSSKISELYNIVEGNDFTGTFFPAKK